MACSVKTYPDLGIAALSTHRDRELAVWYLLRFLDADGNGRVAREALESLVEQLHLMSADNLRRRLRRGQGTFWKIVGSWLYYRSLGKLCADLDVLPERSPVAVPLEVFNSLGRLRSYFYASWLNQGSNPIARQTIARETGIQKKTQIRYEKKAQVHVDKNRAVKPYEQGDQVLEGAFVSRDHKWLNVPMPNTFRPLLEQLPRGQLKKARRFVRGLLKGRPTEPIARRYFRTATQAHKCKRRSEIFFVDRHRLWRGAQLWSVASA